MSAAGHLFRATAMTVDEVARLEPRAVLVVRQHNQMGDMMLAIPALRAIRQRWPVARIGVVTAPIHRDVLQNNPYVDCLYRYDKRAAFGFWRTVRQMRGESWDLSIALHTVSFSLTTLMLSVLSGARVRVGSATAAIGEGLTGSFLNLTLPLPSARELAGMNEAEHNLFPLRAIGVDTTDLSPVIVPGSDGEAWAREKATQCWRSGSWRLVVHPGAGKAENMWPASRFAAVVSAIAATAPARVVVMQGPSDHDAVEAFRRASDRPICVVSGSIGQAAAFLRTADLVLCNDTGIMHVAAAVGARTLAVFGKTDPDRWAPRCANLHALRSPSGTLEGVTVEAVVRRALQLLGPGAPCGVNTGE